MSTYDNMPQQTPTVLGKGSKTPGTETFRGGGRGLPPLSVKKKSIKNWPKNSVFRAKNAVFGGKNPFLATDRPLRGEGDTPFFH